MGDGVGADGPLEQVSFDRQPDDPLAGHPSKLVERGAEVLHVLQGVRGDHRVERPVAERELLDVAVAPPDVGMRPTPACRDCDVAADDVVVGRQPFADVAETARDVEHALPPHGAQHPVERLGGEVGGALLEARAQALVEGGEIGA